MLISYVLLFDELLFDVLIISIYQFCQVKIFNNLEKYNKILFMMYLFKINLK